jgi:hypothetical protein
MEFKVGDEVKIIRNSRGYEFLDKYVGKTYKIKEDYSNKTYELGNGYWWPEVDLELIKEDNNMKKSDLKTGMLVKDRDNRWYVVLKDRHGAKDIISGIIEGSGFDGLEHYNDNLINKSGFKHSDFMIVATPNISTMYGLKGAIDKEDYTILWQRKSEKEEQLENIIGELQGQLKEKLNELEEIQKGGN